MIEERFNAGAEVQMRAGFRPENVGADAVLTGCAVVYGVETTIAGEFREVIVPGAFEESLRHRDVVATFDHKTFLPLGRRSAGTLLLEDRRDGLWMNIALPDTSYGRDLRVSIARGDVRGASFTFTVPEDGEEWIVEPAKPLLLRRVLRAHLHELGPVTFPAYTTTSVAVDRGAGLEPYETAPPAVIAALAARSDRIRQELARL